MTEGSKQARRRRKRVDSRKTYQLDDETLADLAVVQQALRGSSATFALKMAVRKMASMVREVEKGNKVLVVAPDDTAPFQLDIPKRGA